MFKVEVRILQVEPDSRLLIDEHTQEYDTSKAALKSYLSVTSFLENGQLNRRYSDRPHVDDTTLADYLNLNSSLSFADAGMDELC